MIIVGIDCGVHGAIARLDRFMRDGNFVLNIEDMPTLKIKKRKGQPSQIDVPQLARIIDEMTCGADLIVIEQAQMIPGTGQISQVAQQWKNFGLAYGMAASSFRRVELVQPSQWKRALHCPRDKDGARQRASQLLPQHAGLWKLKKDDGRAEAALLAFYGGMLDMTREYGEQRQMA
jgi:crossover junction endodeoxyribonuclease RuvC